MWILLIWMIISYLMKKQWLQNFKMIVQWNLVLNCLKKWSNYFVRYLELEGVEQEFQEILKWIKILSILKMMIG